MNPNFAPENPSTLVLKDASLFARLDERSFAGTLRDGVRVIKKGADWTGGKLIEGADAIGDELLDKKATKNSKRVVGLGIEGAGLAGLTWLASKMWKSKSEKNNSQNTTANTPQESWISKLTKGFLLMGGVGVAGYVFSKFSIADWIGNIPGAKTLEDAKKAAEDAKKKADETIGKLTETVNRLETRISELPALIASATTGEAKKKLEEELASAKSALGKAKTEILHHHQESSVAQAAIDNIGNAMAGEAAKKNKEADVKQKILEKTWKETLSILMKNGIITNNEAENLKTKEEFEAFIKEAGMNSAVGTAIKNAIGETENETSNKMKYAIPIGMILLFLVKRKLKAAFGIGIIATAGTMFIRDEKRTAQDWENTENAAKELFELYSTTLKENGYTDDNITTFFKNILGDDFTQFMSLVGVVESYITPDFAKNNKDSFSDLKSYVSKKTVSNEHKALQQEAMGQINEIIIIGNAAEKTKKAIDPNLLYDLFFKLKLLGITPRANGIHNTGNLYSIDFQFYNANTNGESIITLKDLPFNPLPDVLSVEETVAAYSDKQYELISILEKDIAGFIEYLKQNTERYKSPYSSDNLILLHEKIKTINNDFGTASFPQDDFDRLFADLKKMENGIEGVKVENNSEMIYITLPNSNACTLIGLSKKFNKDTTNPQRLHSADTSTMYQLAAKAHEERFADLAIDGVRNNMTSLYKTLPMGSKLKEHISQYLTNQTDGILDDQIMYDTAWWGEFYVLLFTEPSQNAWAKITNGIFTVVTPLGEFAFASLVDPLTVQVEALGHFFGIRSGVSFFDTEWFSRSFIGTGVLFASYGTVKGIINGNGWLGKIWGGFLGGTKGFASGVIRYNPLSAVVETGGKWYIRKKVLESIESGRAGKYTELWKDGVKGGHFLSNNIQYIRSFLGGDPYKYLAEKYANILKRMDLFKTGRGNKIRSKYFLESLEQQLQDIKKIYNNIHTGTQASSFSDFEKIATAMAKDGKTFADAVDAYAPDRSFDAKLETLLRSNTNITNASREFATIRTDIQTKITNLRNANNELLGSLEALLKQSYADEVYMLIKNYKSPEVLEVKRLLTSIKNVIITDSSLSSLVGQIDDAMSAIDKGKTPKLWIGNISPFRSGWVGFAANSRLIPSFQGVMRGVASVKNGVISAGAKAIKVAPRVDIAVDAVAAGSNLWDSADKELSEGVRQSYEDRAWINSLGASAKVGSLRLPPLASAIAYSVVSGTQSLVLGVNDAQMKAHATERDVGILWTEEEILKKITFMASTDLDTDIKNLWHDLFGQEAEKGHTIKEIRTIFWGALAIINSKKLGYTDVAQQAFRETYFKYISKNTDSFDSPNKSIGEVHEMHTKAIAFATTIADGIVQNIAHGVDLPFIIENISIPIFTKDLAIPAVSKEVAKQKGTFVSSLISFAKQKGYTGEENEEALKNTFLTAAKKTDNGIYWHTGSTFAKAGWYIHRMETLVPDECIDDPTDAEKIAHLIRYFNTHKHAIITPDNYGTFERAIDDTAATFGVKDKNREVMKSSVQEVTDVFIRQRIESSGYKGILQQEPSQFTKGMMIFALVDGYSGDFTMDAIQKEYKNTINIGFNTSVSWDESQKQWFVSAYGMPKKSFTTTEELMAIDSGVVNHESFGQLRTLQQCMEIAKTL